MDSNVQIKLEWENSLRRASVNRAETLAGAKRVVAQLLGLDASKAFDLTYKDEEGDTITIGSDLEMRQLLEDAIATKKSLRLAVVAVASPEKQAGNDPQEEYEQQEEEQQEPQQPTFPFANVARALSDRETVERVLMTFQSEAVVSAVTSFATAYSETQGNQALAGLAVLPQVPALMGVVAELVNEVPVLKDVQELVMPMVMAHCCGSTAVPPMAQACGTSDESRHCPPHGGGRHHHHPRHHGGHPCRPHHGGGHHDPHHGHHGGPHDHHHHPGHHDGHHHHGGPPPHEHWGGRGQAHFGVVCDGCSSDEALKQHAQREGHMSHRGFIRGMRYKSHSIQDFDLCESCHANEQRFPGAVYGPFTSMPPSERPKCWGWQRGGGRGGPWRRGCGRNEQDVPAAEEASASETTQTWEGLVGAFRQAVSEGAEAFSQAATAAKGEGGELAEIARAIAESLKESQPSGKPTAAQADPAEQQKPEVAKPAAVVVEQAAKPVAADPFAKWAQQLRQLETLGFDKSETYIGFLEEENGDLERVVNRIVRRDM